MLVLGLVSLAVFIIFPFLTGFIPVADVPQIMSSQMRKQTTNKQPARPHRFRGRQPLSNEIDTNKAPEKLIHPTPPTPIVEEPAVETTQGVAEVAVDLLHDLEALAGESKETMKHHVIEVYNQYVPDEVASLVNNSFAYWQTHSSYKVYKEHDEIINNVLFIVGLLITLKVALSLLKFLFGSKNIDEIIIEEEEEEVTVSVFDQNGEIDKQYTEFEVMPACTGKAEAEEAVMTQSYEALKMETSDSIILKELSKLTRETSYPQSNGYIKAYTNGVTVNGHTESFSVLDGSTPRQLTPDVSSNSSESHLASPLLAKSQLHKADSSPESAKSPLNSRGSVSNSISRSVSPEDSFEREERYVDHSLSQMNESRVEARPYTPSRLSTSSTMSQSMSTSMEYSPSKKLIYKNSMSILTSHQVVPAETTIGSINEEAVYSELSRSEDSEVMTPLRNQL